MRINGKSVSEEMPLFKDDWCEGECEKLMDEGDPFHFVDGEKWCKDCVEQLKIKTEEI